MKKIFLSILFLTVTASIFAQNHAVLQSKKTNANIISNNESGITFINSLGGFDITTTKSKDGEYSKIIVPEYFPDNNIGFPELPVMTKLIEVPLDAKFEINIISYDEEIVDLNSYGFELPIIPNQASLFKNQNIEDVPFEKNLSIYKFLEFYKTNPIKVELISKMRGVQVAQITVSPFSYDIETNTLTIKNNIVVEIIYKNIDLEKSAKLKSDKYSPAFSGSYNSLWNYKAPATKDVISKYPISYVIISDRMFETALAPFIEWKTKKGFYVTVAYTDEIGTTTTTIKNYIQSLYDAGTPENPAPTYVLFVGDIAQVPPFQASGHVSDMYYCEFDGGEDYIPEIFFGRFSANDLTQLQPQIEKTLMFEEYTFPDPAFLGEVVLVAGDDASFGPTHANGQVNYANNYYFNEDHGLSTNHTYLYPASGSSSSAIIANISAGVGYVNYTAHCNENGWGGPSFTVSNIPSLANQDEYFFSIGNCCLSNKFDKAECFGEALLRVNKKGAVAHIGGSNNTLWNEDFYWSCGVASTINASTSYLQTTQAAYDHLFHDNGEDPYVSAYAIIYAGNLAVSASTSTSKKYYWEIYHVMGDPSLMPYVGVPAEIEATYLPTLSIGMTSLTVTTEPDAYVAISIGGVLLDASLANNFGEAVLDFEPLSNVGAAVIVVTKQFRAPHIGEAMIIPNDNDYDAMMKLISIPANIVHITETTVIPTVEIMNLGQINMTSVDVAYTLNSGIPVVIHWTGNLETLEIAVVTFPEIVLSAGNNSITAYVSNPNEQVDEYPSNDQIIKNSLVYSGNAKILSAETPLAMYCNTSMFTPTFTIKNFDSYPLTSALVSFNISGYNQEQEWTGNLATGETAQINFANLWANEGSHTIIYQIVSVNGGVNIATSGSSLSKDFTIISHGNQVVVDVLTDCYPDETSWRLTNDENSEVLYSEGPLSGENSHIIKELCLSDGCYTFTILDSWGDGMSGSWNNSTDGSVLITNTSNSEIIWNFAAGSNWSQKSIQFCIITSEVKTAKNNYQIYPNPTSGLINFEFGDKIENVSVYNNLGQLLLQKKVEDYNTSVNIESYPNGIYLIKLVAGGQSITKKFILEK